VRDMAAVYWRHHSSPKSLYVATDEGVFIINFTENLQNLSMIDLKNDQNYGYAPMLYDQDIRSVDYFWYDISEKVAFVVATTPYTIYVIEDNRNNDGTISSINVSQIVDGTYLADVVSLSFPDNTLNSEDLLTVTDNGLIKELDSGSWSFVGTAFDVGVSGRTGTDITAKPTVSSIDIMASSKDANEGSIMYSSDRGDTWTDSSPSEDPVINMVAYDPVASSDYVYAAGILNYVWFSTNNGTGWTTSGSFSSPTFNDIYADPAASRDDYVYVGGSGNVKAVMYDGSSWSTIETGLSSVTDVNQFAKHPDINALYAATDLGVYKIDLGTTPLTWSSRTYGTNAADIGTITNHPNNKYAFLAATSPDAQTPMV
jgi:hypothetical protein